jgi:hypothetical protein
VAIINLTPPTVFLTIFNSGIQPRLLQTILNCKEKVGSLKTWELLAESWVEGNNCKLIGRRRTLTYLALTKDNLNKPTKTVTYRPSNA